MQMDASLCEIHRSADMSLLLYTDFEAWDSTAGLINLPIEEMNRLTELDNFCSLIKRNTEDLRMKRHTLWKLLSSAASLSKRETELVIQN